MGCLPTYPYPEEAFVDPLTLGLASLLVIVIVAYLAPYVASLIPGKPIPEAVFLVFAGAFLGTHGLGVIDSSLDSISLLSQLGCAFLFLMAGYEIDVKQISGPIGRHSSLTWVFSLIIAIALVPFLPLGDTSDIGRLAFALAMTTTAFGTLAPIMRERGLNGTPVGNAVTAYGSIGEVLPVLAMGILLSTHGTWSSIVSIAVYLLLCIFVLRRTKHAKAKGKGTLRFMRENAEGGAQTMVRATVLLLVFLVTMANDMYLDIVVGAFAAGFILRALIPEGNKSLEGKLEAIAFGFFVPLFFIVSGTAIDLTAVADNPLLFIGFIGLLLLVRALPVLVSLRIWPETRSLTLMESFSTSMYCTMALPVIVAITSVAVAAGAMTESMASVLVTGGAFTVLVVPLITAVARKIESTHPVEAMQEIADGTGKVGDVMRSHIAEQKDETLQFHKARRTAWAEGRRLSSADFLAMRHHLYGDEPRNESEKAGQPQRDAGVSAAEESTPPSTRAAGAEARTAATNKPATPGAPAKASIVIERPKFGLLVLAILWFILTIAFGIFVFSVEVAYGDPLSPIEVVLVIGALFNAISLALVLLRKHAARPATIGFNIAIIGMCLLSHIALGQMQTLVILLFCIPDVILIVYFTFSRHVKEVLVAPL